MEWGVNVAVFDDEGRILLTQREDFEVWCLPGGGMDEGETPSQAAVREAKEETGLDVQLKGLVGIYSYPSWMGSTLNIITFSAVRVGGELCGQAGEVVDLRFFRADALPAPEEMLVGQPERIRDAFEGRIGKVQTEVRAWAFPAGVTRKELYALRDASGMTRRGFYQAHFSPLKPDQITVHLAGKVGDDDA